MIENKMSILSAKDLDLIVQGLKQHKSILISYQKSKNRLIIKEVIPLKP